MPQLQRDRSARITALALVTAALGALLLLQRATSRDAGVRPAASWPGAAAAAPGPSSATRYRLDASGHAHSAWRGPRRGRVAWRFATGGRITAQPVVAPDGNVYVASHDGYLYALDARGELRFRRALGAPAFGGALLDADGNLYVGSDAGMLWSFEADGTQRFAVPLGAAIDTAPALDATGKRVLCAAGRSLFALRSGTGERVWRFDAWGKIFTTPVVDAHGIYFGAQDRRVYALTPEGSRRWAYETGGDVDASPALSAQGVVYAGSDDGSVYALADDGQLRFRHFVGGHLRAPVALAGDPVAQVVAVAHGLRPALLLLSVDDGSLLGRLPLGLADSQEQSGYAGPVVDAAGVVYLGLPDHRVLAIGRDTTPLWSFATHGPVHSSPVIGPDGTLYIGSDDGTLYAFRD